MMMTACGNKANTETAAETVEEGVENIVETLEITEANYERGTGVIVYTPAQFPTQVQPDPELPVVIDFNATWCGPCKRFEPVFEASAKAHPEAIYLSVDVDDNPKAADQFGVRTIPMVVVLMPDGTTRSRVGAMDEAEFAEFLGF